MQMKQEQLLSIVKGWFPIKNHVAFSLVEVILATAVFGLLVTALVGAYLYGQEATSLAGSRARGVMLAEEGVEAVRNIRDSAVGFLNLPNSVGTGLITSGNQWGFSGSNDISDIFTRQTSISAVDSYRKTVTTNVTWQQNTQRTGSISIVTRFTDWFRSGFGNWATPVQTTTLDFNGNQDGKKVAVSGSYAYVIRNGGSPDFLVIDISNPISPTLVGSLAFPNALTNITILGNYAYVSGTGDSSELQIIDVSIPASPSIVGTFNAAGNANANGVFISGSTVYIVRDSSASDEFVVINVSTVSSPTLIGSLDLGAKGYEVTVVGNYAYVASDSDSQELIVINITTPTLPSLAGSLNLTGNTDAITIAAFGTTVVMGQGSNLNTLNVSTPASPSLLGTVALGGIVNDISLGNNNLYVFTATSNNANEFRVVDITTLGTPTILGSVNITGNNQLFGVAYEPVGDRAYGVGDPNIQEFFVFSPQ